MPTFNDKEWKMLLYMTETMRRLKVDDFTLFRIAHCYQFGTVPDLRGDVLRFQQEGIIPQYVIAYLKVLERTKN